MNWVAELEIVEKRLEHALCEKRFDTVKLLLSERFQLVKKALRSPDKEKLRPYVEGSTRRWVELLEGRIKQTRKRLRRPRSYGGYGHRSGRMINRSL